MLLLSRCSVLVSGSGTRLGWPAADAAEPGGYRVSENAAATTRIIGRSMTSGFVV